MTDRRTLAYVSRFKDHISPVRLRWTNLIFGTPHSYSAILPKLPKLPKLRGLSCHMLDSSFSKMFNCATETYHYHCSWLEQELSQALNHVRTMLELTTTPLQEIKTMRKIAMVQLQSLQDLFETLTECQLQVIKEII